MATSVIAGPLGSFGIQGALTALGFTSNGVAASSLAAAFHSSIGIVKAKSLFALAQSMGATGAFVGPAGILAGISVALGAGTGYWIYQKIQGNKKIQ